MSNDPNQKVGQLADIAQKEFGRLAARLRRIGHDKPGKQMAALDPASLDPVSRTLFHRWRRAEQELEREALDPSQTSLEGLDPADDGPDFVDGGSFDDRRPDVVNRGIERLITGMPRFVATPERFAEIRELNAEAGIRDGERRVQMFEFDDELYIVGGVVDPEPPYPGIMRVALANRVVPKASFEGETRKRLAANEVLAEARGLIVEGSSKRLWVTTGERLAVVCGDPLAEELDAEVDAEMQEDAQEQVA